MASDDESQWLTQYTSLILVDHGVKINEAYYCNVMLLQQFLLAIRQISSKFFVFQQGSAPARAHTALRQSAFFPVTLLYGKWSWDGKMGTSQIVTMLCRWGVNADMACLQVKLCVATSGRCIKCIWYLRALYKCPGLLTFTLLLLFYF